MKILRAPLIIIIALACSALLWKSIKIVPANSWAVKHGLGSVPNLIDQNKRIHFVVPMLQSIQVVPATIQSTSINHIKLLTSSSHYFDLSLTVYWKVTSPSIYINNFSSKKSTDVSVSQAVSNTLRAEVENNGLQHVIVQGWDTVFSSVLAILPKQFESQGIRIVDIDFLEIATPSTDIQTTMVRMKKMRSEESHQYAVQGSQDSLLSLATSSIEEQKILAEAYKESQEIKSKASSTASRMMASAIGSDTKLYHFYRTLDTYRKTIDTNTTLVITPESELFQYFSHSY